MHEFSVATQVLATARELAVERDADRIDRIDLAVGEASHVNPAQLRTCLDAAAADTMAADASVTIESVAPHATCDCGWAGEPDVLDAALAYAPNLTCPDCGARLTLDRGDGCYLVELAVSTADSADADAATTGTEPAPRHDRADPTTEDATQ